LEKFNSNKLFKNLLVSCPNQDGGMYLSSNKNEFIKICNHLSTGFDIKKNYFVRSFQAENPILYFINLNANKEIHFNTYDPHDVKIIDNKSYWIDAGTLENIYIATNHFKKKNVS